jgi:fatty-acid desaturase
MTTHLATSKAGLLDEPRLLAAPIARRRHRIAWRYASVVIGYHLIALLALSPWLFSWTGVVLAVIGLHVFGVIGINIGYHRLLTHRAFVCPISVEHSLAVLGLLSMQDAPARWVAVHRRHHQHADEKLDPHTPLANFFWGHIGWLLVEHPDLTRYGIYERYARDILRDRFYVQLERNVAWILLLSWAVFFLGGLIVELLIGGSFFEAVQFGSSLFLWGVVVRTVLSWHVAWSVNSVTHLWGYRNYETNEESRNNVFIAMISAGEGWHNNHHAEPRSAKHGHLWWEVDVSYMIIRLLGTLGLASKIVLPHGRFTTARNADGRMRARGDEEISTSLG